MHTVPPTTEYFREVVLARRSYLTIEMVARVAADRGHFEPQPDGRIRVWARVPELQDRWLRVVPLEDGRTIHNAFLDRDGPPHRRPSTP